jgi:2-(1,2-epoxy-1,2-dihydrophenyl)acetyl-CoA isomerase
LIPDSGGTFFLPRIIGFQKAMALMMTGDKVSAQEAVAMNMIYKSVPADQFAEVIRLFSENLAKMPTKALGLTKRAMNQSMQNDLTQQLALEELLQTEAGQTHDFNEGVQSFLEKRKPVFTGK